jgi:zeaxanthin glucosyltransferase
MSRFGIICPPITGHVNPLAALGRVLTGRGHRVTFFHIADLEPKVRAEELEFVALESNRFPPGRLAESVAHLAALNGLKSLKYAIQCECRISELILESGPSAVKAADIDVLLVDQNEPAGATVAEHLGLPFASICTSLPLNREPLIPPPFVDWPYRDSLVAGLRNKTGYRISDHFIAPIQKTLNRFRAEWKLPLLRTPDDSFSRTTQLAQMPHEFDFPRKHLPAGFQYLGPWFDDYSGRVSFPFDKLDGRPMIYGSLGTLQPKDSHYFRIMAEACAGLDAQLVLSLGSLEGISIPELPGRPLVVNYAPQVELLSRAAVTITHSGMNTTQQSLYFGVPMIAIPLSHDQPAIGARLARTGAGIVIPPRQLTTERLRTALQLLLAPDNSYRTHAQQMQMASRQAGGPNRAADIIEAMPKRNR